VSSIWASTIAANTAPGPSAAKPSTDDVTPAISPTGSSASAEQTGLITALSALITTTHANHGHSDRPPARIVAARPTPQTATKATAARMATLRVPTRAIQRSVKISVADIARPDTPKNQMN